MLYETMYLRQFRSDRTSSFELLLVRKGWQTRLVVLKLLKFFGSQLAADDGVTEDVLMVDLDWRTSVLCVGVIELQLPDLAVCRTDYIFVLYWVGYCGRLGSFILAFLPWRYWSSYPMWFLLLSKFLDNFRELCDLERMNLLQRLGVIFFRHKALKNFLRLFQFWKPFVDSLVVAIPVESAPFKILV